ncbi:hypothetical protein EJB05_41853 [Eragrostis curvula]|uniref:Knottin scorpion toxin-like domain-containing protein n=1 Tax=Eragrostis curvula TaxID=38414 RepID=A0A5J9TBS6_9POAL|nr:hypothetical protein EJB05_41853 [Eragrostis curvula]
MAAFFSSCACRVLFIAVIIVAVLSSSAAGRYVCEGKCSDIPDCNNWCRAVGYPKGGQCVPPLYQYCCCIA